MKVEFSFIEFMVFDMVSCQTEMMIVEFCLDIVGRFKHQDKCEFNLVHIVRSD